jgi:outer membrane lipoprotein-sorting protein
MKKVIFLLTVAIVSSLANAQSDAKSTAILNEVSAKTKAYKSVQIDFIYSMENKKEKINDKFKGTLLSKGDKYRLSVARQDVICDGKTVWTFLKDANEVQINNAGEDDDSFTPTKLLSNYTKEYKSKFVEEKGNSQVIELFPLAKGKSFTKVRLTIDKSKKQIQQFVIYDRGGTIFTYLVNKFLTDQPVNDKEFTFNKAEHPKVTIDDMR